MFYEFLMNIFTKNGYGHRVIKMHILPKSDSKLKITLDVLLTGFNITGLVYMISSELYLSRFLMNYQ